MSSPRVFTYAKKRPVERAEDFLNVSSRCWIIEEQLFETSEFFRFCDTLGLSNNVALELSSDRCSRGYLALRRWFNLKIQTTEDLSVVLKKFAPALGVKLGLYEDSPLPPPPPPTMTGANSIAHGFEVANKVESAASFIRDTENVFLQEICSALNKSERYGQLLELFGVLPSIDSNKRLAELQEKWNNGRLTGKRGNPALAILTDLCGSSKFAALPLEELADKLMRCDSQSVQVAVSNWIAAISDHKKEVLGEIKASVDRHEELRFFFTHSKLASNEAQVQEFIDLLTQKEIDIHTLEDMRHMTSDDFRTAGFSLRLSKAIVAEVEKHFTKGGFFSLVSK